MKIAKVSTKANIADMGKEKMGDTPVNKFSRSVAFKEVVIAENGKQDSAKDGNCYLEDVDTDLHNIFLFAQGRVRFGDGVNSARGENISGEFCRMVSSGSANTEFAVPHHLGSIPIGYIVLWCSDKNGLYGSPTSGTPWTTTNIYLKCEHTNVDHLIFILK